MTNFNVFLLTPAITEILLGRLPELIIRGIAPADVRKLQNLRQRLRVIPGNNQDK